jgi:hypothetical protein
MANVAQHRIQIYIGECGPIAVKEPGQAAFGELVRYIRKRHKIHPDDVGMLYGKIAEGSPVTGRHILRMEHNDSFFPKDPNRRWVLATLVHMPPELMAYLSLEATIPEQEKPEISLFPTSTKAIDTAEYYNTLQSYWIDGYPKGLKYAIKDVKRRIHLLKDKVLFEFSLEKPLLTRLLCGYKILLADYAIMQQDSTAAQQYLTDAFTLADEREYFDLQALALKQRMLISVNDANFEAALGDFEMAQQLGKPVAPQIYGQMITTASKSQSHLARDESDRVATLKQLDHAEKLVQPISPENFLFLATFDRQRYLLDSAQACMESPIKKMRSPGKAEEYLREAARQRNINGKSVNACRQVDSDLIQTKIYCDQGHYLVAATTAEQAVVTLKGLQSKIHLNEITALLAEMKEHVPLEIEVMSLEAELMKVQQPYLFR